MAWSSKHLSCFYWDDNAKKHVCSQSLACHTFLEAYAVPPRPWLRPQHQGTAVKCEKPDTVSLDFKPEAATGKDVKHQNKTHLLPLKWKCYTWMLRISLFPAEDGRVYAPPLGKEKEEGRLGCPCDVGFFSSLRWNKSVCEQGRGTTYW